MERRETKSPKDEETWDAGYSAGGQEAEETERCKRFVATALNCGHTILLRIEASDLEGSRSVRAPETARDPFISLVEETASSCAIYHT